MRAVIITLPQQDKAIDQYLNAIKLDDTFPGSHLYLGLAYAQKHDYAKAGDELKKAYDSSGGIAVTVAAFGRLYAEQGKKAEAEKVLKQLEDMKKKSYVSSFYIAFIYSGLGDKDQAIQWLNRAYDEKSDYLVYLNVLPLLDDLREEPGFKELVRRVGL
jgi:tetratricopeptide (TPR) repeat protein